MKITKEKKELSDIEKIKNFLIELGFVCNSYPSAQHLIYSKDGETVLIKNNKT
jgi:hypothetical protein